MTVRRSLAWIGATAVLAGSALMGAPSAVAAVPDGFEQIALCVSDVRRLDPVLDGVSWAQRSLGWTGTWDLSRGTGVTVAVIDTGVNPGPAFGDRLRGGTDVVPLTDAKPGLSDCDGHGTAVAGLIGGSPDTTSGWAGVAPEVSLVSYRASTLAYAEVKDGKRTPVGSTDTVIAAINAAVADGADVINISVAYCGSYLSSRNPDLEAAVRRAIANDVVVVAAAGNLGEQGCQTQNTSGASPSTGALPAGIDEVLTVGSVTRQGLPSEFSLAGDWVDVAAPGEHLITVNPPPGAKGQVDAFVTDDGSVPIAGTSFSAAYVTGVVALVRARFPDLSATQVRDRIESTANHPGGQTHRTLATGYGSVNPRRALTAVIPAEGDAGLPVLPPSRLQPEAPAPQPVGEVAAALPAPEPVPSSDRARTIAFAGTLIIVGLFVAAWTARAIRRSGPAEPPTA